MTARKDIKKHRTSGTWTKERPSPRSGAGRKKGTPNRLTRDMRQLLAHLAEENYDDAAKAMKRLWRHQPARALALWLKVQEFITPRLQAIALANVPPSLPPGSVKPIDATEAAQVYARIIRGELDPAAVDFAALPAPGGEGAPIDAPGGDDPGRPAPAKEASK